MTNNSISRSLALDNAKSLNYPALRDRYDLSTSTTPDNLVTYRWVTVLLLRGVDVLLDQIAEVLEDNGPKAHPMKYEQHVTGVGIRLGQRTQPAATAQKLGKHPRRYPVGLALVKYHGAKQRHVHKQVVHATANCVHHQPVQPYGCHHSPPPSKEGMS